MFNKTSRNLSIIYFTKITYNKYKYMYVYIYTYAS